MSQVAQAGRDLVEMGLGLAPPWSTAAAILGEGRGPYGRGHLAKRRLVLGIGEEAVVGKRLEEGDQVGLLGIRQGEAGDEGVRSAAIDGP